MQTVNYRSQLEDPAWLAGAIQSLQLEIDTQIAEMERIKGTLLALREAQRSLMKVAEALPASLGRITAGSPPTECRQDERGTPKRQRRQPRTETVSARILDGVRVALKEAGRPLNRTELLRFLTAHGVVITANDPARAVGKVLWRSEEFVHLKNGYWFSDGSGGATSHNLP